jgi:hypothetical protein
VILPTKHISTDKTLLGVGAILLGQLNKPYTVSGLWEQVKTNANVGNYERYILTLVMLNLIGSVDMRNGLLERVPK